MIVTGVGDMLGFPKCALVNFVLRHVQEAGAGVLAAGRDRLQRRARQGAFENLDPVTLGHDDIAFLQYTGGTTGVAKGAMLTHRNMVANVLQSEAWIGPSLRAASGR